jgi:hypothetical protein
MTCKIVALDYGVCFNTYFFPLKISELANGLEKRGYEISPDLPVARPPVMLGGSGVIARKGKTMIHVETRRQILTIVDISTKSALECFDEITNMLKEDYKINIEGLIELHEFNAQYEVPTERQAFETIAKNVEVPILNQIGEALEKKLWLLELRFGGAGMKFNSSNWFECTIEPNLARNDSFLVNITYRNKEQKEVRNFMESFEEKVNAITALIDR